MFAKKLTRNSITTGSGSTAIGTHIEDLFSIYGYTGNGTTNQIVNNIDLDNNEGLVIIKGRKNYSVTGDGLPWFADTIRGNNKYLTVGTANEFTSSSSITSFNSDGFTLGTSDDLDVNINGNPYISYSFRKKANFLDIQSFTAASSGSTTVSHNLGCMPGFIILKSLDGGDWKVFCNGMTSSTYLRLNSSSSLLSATDIVQLGETSITFNGNWLVANYNYIMYIFPATGTGFGDNSSSTIVKSGLASVESDVNLGFDPQFLLVKNNGGGSWLLFDKLRGMSSSPGTSKFFAFETSLEEFSASPPAIEITADGFKLYRNVYTTGQTFIYLAIARGPMRIPTVANTVFSVATYTGTGVTNNPITTNFPPDMVMTTNRGNGNQIGNVTDRERGKLYTRTSSIRASNGNDYADIYDLFGSGLSPNKQFMPIGTLNTNGENYVSYAFRRAPKFFDIVNYQGLYGTKAVKHNLKAVPELIMVKGDNGFVYQGSTLYTSSSSSAILWTIYNSYLFNYSWGARSTTLSFNNATNISTVAWDNRNPTEDIFYVGSSSATNLTNLKYSAYLFASCPGVSKVGSYIGDGSSTPREIDCGFAAGARLVFIKSAGAQPWLAFDTARGMTSGSSPYTNLGETNTGPYVEDSGSYIQTSSRGFTIKNSNININSLSTAYLYLAIA